MSLLLVLEFSMPQSNVYLIHNHIGVMYRFAVQRYLRLRQLYSPHREALLLDCSGDEEAERRFRIDSYL